jgi:hypothetical protein
VLPDSISDALENDNLNILSSEVRFAKDYALGDDDVPLNVIAKEITTSWRGDEIERDSIDNLSFGAEFTPQQQNETDSTFIFSIPQDLTMQWLNSGIDDEEFSNNGIFIMPDSEVRKIAGFRTVTTAEQRDIPKLNVIVEKPGDFVDTVSFNPFWDTYIAKGEMPDVDERMFLQGGLPIRTKLTVDISGIETGSVVNKVNLRLYEGDNYSYRGQSAVDSITVQYISDSTGMEVAENFRELLSKQNGYFAGEITSAVQRWVNGEENYGLRLRMNAEDSHADRFSFYDHNADINNKPFIEIIYTKKN